MPGLSAFSEWNLSRESLASREVTLRGRTLPLPQVSLLSPIELVGDFLGDVRGAPAVAFPGFPSILAEDVRADESFIVQSPRFFFDHDGQTGRAGSATG